MNWQSLNTPAALIDVERMNHNIERMQQRLNALGVSFRPHVKTTKCEQVVKAQMDAGARGITVSTLKEAEQFFASGIRDIVYAVGMAPTKLSQALALRRQGCALKIVADSVACARGHRRFRPGARRSIRSVDRDRRGRPSFGHRTGRRPAPRGRIDPIEGRHAPRRRDGPCGLQLRLRYA